MTEDEMDQFVEQQEATQDLAASYGYPTPPPKESIYKFFKFLIKEEDSSKFSNLSSQELGIPTIPVRGFQSIALDLENAWGMDKVAKYFRAGGEITLATSLSKKGFLASLFVTQIKREKKDKPKEIKKGLFSGFGKQEQGEET